MIGDSSQWAVSSDEMAVWARLATLAEVGLRVPPLFVVDELLKRSLGLPVPVGESEVDSLSVTLSHGHNHTPDQHLNLTLFADAAISQLTDADASDDIYYYNVDFVKAFLYTFAKFLFCCCGKPSCFLLLSVPFAIVQSPIESKHPYIETNIV